MPSDKDTEPCGTFDDEFNRWLAEMEQQIEAIKQSELLCPICFIELAEAIGISEVWKVAPNERGARQLTLPELNHLSGLLEARRKSGDYTGPREQYYARTERLIQWCNQQMKGK